MSGKKAKQKRKAVKSELKLEQPQVTLKLDLACGQNCQPGFEGVDMWEGAKHQLNLLNFPWPFADSSVSELHCSHFIEHIPMEFVDEFGNYVPCGTPGSKDLLFKFFDECYRILTPDGWMTIVTPCARNNRAFQDPTHRRFFVAESFFYLFGEFRRVNKLDHYNVKCDFEGNINPTVLEEMNARSSDVQTRMFNECWNAVVDWHVKLKALKKPT